MAQEQSHAGGHGMQSGPAPAATPSLEDYDRRLAAEPGNERLHVGKISLLCGLGRHEDALVACDTAIAMRPGDARLLARKAHMLHSLGRHGEAMEAVEVAMGAPGSPTARVTAASRQVPSAAADRQARRLARVEMARELAGFIEYLADRRIIDDATAVDTVEGRRNLQKYAYIAQALGMRIGYRFDFIESGAFSTSLAVDAHSRKTLGVEAVAFRPDPRASDAFVGLVRGRDADWLQVATFAARDLGVDGALKTFVESKHGRMEYDASLITDVFEKVNVAMAGHGGDSQ